MIDWVRKVDDVVVVILGGGRGTRLDPLTRMRSKPAVPMAGKFRLIDIPISNCIHSRMPRMLLLTQFNSISLHRHITRTYRFDLFSKGFVQIVAAQQTPEGEKWFQGTADAVRQNLHIIREMAGDYVLILSGDHMYRCDYRDMLRDLIEQDGDIGIAVLPCSEKEISDFGAVRVDEEGRILEFREKPKDATAREGMAISPSLRERRKLDESRPYLASMGVYLFKKNVLVECLSGDHVDFGNDIIPRAAQDRHVHAHFYRGYWRDIGTIRAFFDAHMDILRPDPPFHFNDPAWPFYTLPQYLPGARLHRSEFTRSVLTEGTLITDSRIDHSVVGLRTTVRNATVRHSLIMGADPDPPEAPEGSPAVGIGEGTVIENAIVDKNARIGRNVTITNAENSHNGEGDGWVIREGIVVIPKDAIIPDGTTI